ncbi:hypothetical protein ACQPU1_06450 [Clostridium paraputrificum]|uniref:hypothetical protein n=1 Tax=Clostridium paraputrificum TaxID=29363 RepID=UPI003D33354D
MYSDKFKDGIEKLSKARSPREALSAWGYMGRDKKGKFMTISLDEYNKNIYPDTLNRIINSNESSFIPYFESGKLYFMDDNLLEEMIESEGKEIVFPIDYSIMLDTNYSSYIDKFVNNKDLSSLDNNIFSTIDILIREDFRYDYIFYIIENYKNTFYNSQLGNVLSETELKAGYWQNLVSLEMFKNIDKEEYCTKGKIKYNISKLEAQLIVDGFFSDVCSSQIGKEAMENFLIIHKSLVLFLIGVIRIRFQSKKSYHHKIKELFEYMHNTIGVFFQREMIIAHKYFINPQNVQLINKVNKNMTKENLLKSIENFAWDFASPRIMEFFLNTRGEGRYLIPFFLSNDKNLRDLLKMFRVKGVIIDPDNLMPLSIPNEDFLFYFEKNEPDLDTNFYFEGEAIKRRQEILNSNKKNNFRCIEEEFSKLVTVMQCK